MFKKWIPIATVWAAFSPALLPGQSLVGTSGGMMEAQDYSLSYSVGELMTETYTNDLILTQGFQQADDQALSTSDIPQDAGLFVYPNPCRDRLFLQLNEEGRYSVQLFDISGRLMMQQQDYLYSLSSLEVSSLPTGSYILQIRALDREISQSLLIQKTQ